MKVRRLLLFPVLCGMFLSSCGESAPVKKATISIEANQYMTTTLKAGEYELNKAIEFTVSPINEEYSVSSVKMNEVELPPSNSNKYTFTPTEEKAYTLKVTTNKLENKVVYTFEGLTEENYTQKLTKGGTRVFVEPYVSEAGFENVFKDSNLNVANGKQFQLICRTQSEDKNVWIRRIEFTFVEDKNQLELLNADEFESYANGVWTTTLTKGNLGQNSVVFKGVNEAVISKIVITTAPYVAEKAKLEFTGLDADDKIYTFARPTVEDLQNKQLISSDTEFITLQPYLLYVEFGANHAEYYSGLSMKYGNNSIPESKFYDLTSGKEYVYYTLELLDKDVIDGKVSVTVSWTPKAANEFLVIDIASANKYVKGFMETEPKASLYLENAISFGGKVTTNLRPKRGYKNLKMIVNGQTIEREEEKDLYTFTVPFAKPINISFIAEEGNKEEEGKEVIELTGDNKEKGKLLAAELEGAIYVTFYANEDHPTATLTAISFDGKKLDPATPPDGEEEPETKIYQIPDDKVSVYKSTTDKSSLFEVTIQEDSYRSTLRINKGAFKAEIEGKEASEDMGYDVYEVDGKTPVTVKFTLNQYKDLHSIEVNDKRLTDSQFTVNPDGTISYAFTANAKTYDFLIQTKAQKVTLSLDENSTTGYIIKDLPKEFEVGQKIKLSLGVTSEEYSLYDKEITVTYNGEKLAVDENDFTFEILPLKGIEKIKVVVANKPQA